MYWFKPALWRLLVFALAISALQGCKPAIKRDGPVKYFDVKGYFDHEAGRLNRLNPTVNKTVVHNNVSETKAVKVADWKQELGLFADADINKPAWKDSYTVIDEDGQLIYRAKDSLMNVHEVLIKRAGQKVIWILIYTRARNKLYQTNTKLTYYPDSVYMISMDQHVRLLGTNNYSITGVIGK